MRYLVPSTILAACFSLAAFAEEEVPMLEEETVESEITILDQEGEEEGEADEVAALTKEDELKAKK